MAEFLSELWLHELDRAVRAVADASMAEPVVIEQVVIDVPGTGEVRYQFRIDSTGASVTVGAAADAPDVRLTTDFDTAVAIARGRENAQMALANGRLRFGGNIDTLVRSAAALGALDHAAAALRDSTSYPSP